MRPAEMPDADPRARPAPRPGRWLAPGFALLLLGCTGVGPQRLNADQMGYASALGEGQKRQMLLNVVRLRYADVPTFLSVSQLISGYTLQSTGQVGLNAYPNTASGNFVNLIGAVEYTTRPTFTFTPVTGEQFAQSYLRPLAVAELLSLAQSGAPIDLLFRLGVQSVNGLQNGTTIGGEVREASEDFKELTRSLREIQAGGAVALRLERQAGRVYLQLDARGPNARAAARRARQLLGVGPQANELEVIYGRGRGGHDRIAVLTRSVLQILYELSSQIEVGAANAAHGDTFATWLGTASPETRLLYIHEGPRAPPDAFAAVEYRDRWFWIDFDDYRSKAIFSFAYLLQVLAESSRSQPTPLVTIPVQ